MSLKSKIRNHQNIAIFTRNHRKYIKAAEDRNRLRPERFTTFRSSIKWTNAHFANSEYGVLPVYFSPIGSEIGIEYEALLHQIHLDPVAGQPDTIEILASELEMTKNEGLWEQSEKPVKTLYVISHCKKVAKPFPITALIKLGDEKPINENYGYSYSIVFRKGSGSADNFDLYPYEVEDPSKFKEGSTKTVSVNIYERSTAARKACVEHYGFNCIVCGINFYEKYGEIGKDFIHVHHLKGLANLNDEYEVHPINDLRPVCPNCHAMLHRENPPISIDALRATLSQGSSKSEPVIEAERKNRAPA